jgi:Mg-chelatase subunit ChlD
MNSEKPSREEIEAKMTALLLSELPPEEAQLLRWAISQDAEFKKLHDRLQLTVGFVREVAKNPAETIPAPTAPLKLSEERREKLLTHFKTINSVILLPPLKKRHEKSWLMPLAVAAAVVLAAIGIASLTIPNFVKARATSQANANINRLRQLDAEKAQFALENKNSPATATPMATPPSAAPQVALNQRVAGLEAYISNGNPTANGGDAWKKQTTIVLPASRTAADDLAVASLSQSDFYDSVSRISEPNALPAENANKNYFGLASAQASSQNNFFVSSLDSKLADNGQTVAVNRRSGGYGGGGFQQSLGEVETAAISDRQTQMRATGVNFTMPGFAFNLGDKGNAINLDGDVPTESAAENKDAFFATGLTRGDVSSLRNLLTTQNIAQNEPIDRSRFDGNTDAKAAANKVPMLGDLPAMGRLFQSRSKNMQDEGEIAANTAAPYSVNGNINAPDLSKSGTSTLALDSMNSFSGGGAIASPYSNQLLTSGLHNNGPAKDENGNLAFNDGSVQQGNVHQFRSIITAMPSPPVVAAPKAKLRMDLSGGSAAAITLNYATVLPPASAVEEDRPIKKIPSPAPMPQPEMLTHENAFSTFSLNVSDVSFKLAAASLERGQLPDAASIRTEEFINAFDYRDPEPAAGVPVAFVAERARYPFAHNRDLLRFSIKTAAAGREPGRPLNIVLLLDNSGSMDRADRVAIIHEALKVLASQLQPQDTISIVTFARTARLWVDGVRGDQAGTAVNKVSDLTPEGGTNLEEAMNLAYATARRHYLANGVNRVVLLTDGAANLGNVDPEALKQKVESFRKQGIALDCFGIGWEGYNDDLLEVLSSNGDGRYGFINTTEAATTEFAAQLAGALHVAAEDVKVQVEFNPQRVTSYRQIGYAKHQLTKQQFRDNTVAAAPLATREAGNALYTVEVNPQGAGPIATVRVRFRIPGTTDVSEHEWQVPFDGTAPALENSSPALRLAATASAFSEWLASSPFAQEVTTDQLLNYLNGVPAIYGADARPKQLETMIREAKSLSGK